MTIKDIAKLSGYGIGTVSRVLNNRMGVSEKAREKILQVIEENNFEPNESARSLKRRSGSAIGIIIKGNRNLLFADILEKIQRRLVQYGEDAIVEYIDEDGDEVEYAVRLLRDHCVKGIMFLGANLSLFDERVESLEVPCVIVTVDGSSLKHKNISSVCVDDEKATYEMMKYLVQKGHVNISVIGGNVANSENEMSAARFRGCQRCAGEYHLGDILEKNYVSCKYSTEEGYHAAKKLLQMNPEITAIFAMSDTIALGAMRAAEDMGFHVPNDISIAGFDGIFLTDYSVPRLSTVWQDSSLLAIRSVELLLTRMHYDVDGEHEKVSFELMERESVADRNLGRKLSSL